jgi:hypothetical protein
MDSNINEINNSDVFLIAMPKCSELFIANKSKYISTTLNLKDLILLRKKVTEEILRLMKNDKTG